VDFFVAAADFSLGWKRSSKPFTITRRFSVMKGTVEHSARRRSGESPSASSRVVFASSRASSPMPFFIFLSVSPVVKSSCPIRMYNR
jgi:hypothetical protein